MIAQLIARKLYKIALSLSDIKTNIARSLWTPIEDDQATLLRNWDLRYSTGGETFISADGRVEHTERVLHGALHEKGEAVTIGYENESLMIFFSDGTSAYCPNHKIHDLSPIALAKLKKKRALDDNQSGIQPPLSLIEMLARMVKRNG